MASIVRTKAGHWKAVVRQQRFGLTQKTRTFDRMEDAHNWAVQVEASVQRGTWRESSDADRTTFRQALDHYAKEVSVRHRGVKIELATMSVMRDARQTAKPLSEVTRSDAMAMRNEMLDDGLAVSTINRRIGLLHAVYARARDAWDMPDLSNPFDRMKLKGEVRRTRRVSENEIEAIVGATRSPILGTAIRLAVETARRVAKREALSRAVPPPFVPLHSSIALKRSCLGFGAAEKPRQRTSAYTPSWQNADWPLMAAGTRRGYAFRYTTTPQPSYTSA